MNKRHVKYLFLTIFLAFICFISVDAATYYVKITGTDVYARKSPNSTSGNYGFTSVGESYTLLDETPVPDEGKNNKCNEGWYKINFNGSTAYVCSKYVQKFEVEEPSNEPANTDCEKQMAEAGFPSSYWPGLCALKKARPTWNFKAIKTNLEWRTVVEKESSCGTSFIANSDATMIDKTCKNPYTSTWYPASQKAVAYYADPRNWLTEKTIFQFEYLKFDNLVASSYQKGATSIISNSQFYKYHQNVGNDLGSVIYSAGKDTNVSPIFLASRMLQELGNSTSLYNLYSGIYTGSNKIYYGYYNFFNYGVSDSCVKENGTTYCGLSYAKSKNWNSPYNAINGASSNLSSSYISVGQYTTYLQKYNVVPTKPSNLFIHQYMTNIAAPSSESKTTYNTYNKLGILNNAFVFYIPVYNNMGSEIDNSGSGATGEEGNNNPSTSAITTIINSAGYKITNGYLAGIDANTGVSELKGNIESISGNNTVVVMDSKGVIKTSGLIGTGYNVKITNADGNKMYEVVVKGDTSGDGVITALDLLQVQKKILGTYSLKEAYLNAADTSKDGKVTALDLLQVQKNILGTYKIPQ